MSLEILRPVWCGAAWGVWVGREKSVGGGSEEPPRGSSEVHGHLAEEDVISGLEKQEAFWKT